MSIRDEILDYLRLAMKGTKLTEEVLEKVATDLVERGILGDIQAGLEYNKEETKNVIIVHTFEDEELSHCYVYNEQGEYDIDYSLL